MNWLLLKYRPLYQAPDSPSGGGSAPASSSGAGTPSGSSSTPASAPSTSGAPSSGAPAKQSPPVNTPASGATSGAPTTEVPSSDPGMDFDSIFGGPQDGDTPPAVIPPEVPEPAPAAVAPQTPPVVAQPSVQTPTSPQAPTSPAPTQPTGAEAPNLDPTDPLAISRALEANFDVAVDHVAKTLFQLSKEDVEALEADTVGAIPKLLARSMVKSQVNMLQQLGQIVPKMIARQVEALRMNSQNEGKFYQRWPQLKEKGELVRRLAATYRQMNPAARLDTMIEELGPIIMMAAKLPMVAPGQPQNPMAPAAQPTNGIRQPQPSPFVPAMGGPGSPQTAQELSDIEAMFMGEQ